MVKREIEREKKRKLRKKEIGTSRVNCILFKMW